jgi:predicted small secreted protein
VKRQRWSLFVVALATLLAGCAEVRGSGDVVTQSREVSGVTSVDLAEDAELYIEVNGTESLTVTADDNLQQYLGSDVIGSRLVLDAQDHVNLDPTEVIVYKLTVKSLEEIRISGDGSVDARGVHSDQLKIRVSGDGRITIAGNADEQEIRISGDGAYHGENLTSRRASVDISGDGKAVLAVAEKLNANISGDGSIEYLGSPAITQHVSGDGSIRKR